MLYSLEEACSMYGLDDHEEDFQLVVVAVTNRFEGGMEGGRFGCDIIAGTPAVGVIHGLAWRIGELVVDYFLAGKKEKLEEYPFDNVIYGLEDFFCDKSPAEIKEMVESWEFSLDAFVEEHLDDLYGVIIYSGGVEDEENIERNGGTSLCGDSSIINVYYADSEEEYNKRLVAGIAYWEERVKQLGELAKGFQDS